MIGYETVAYNIRVALLHQISLLWSESVCMVWLDIVTEGNRYVNHPSKRRHKHQLSPLAIYVHRFVE